MCPEEDEPGRCVTSALLPTVWVTPRNFKHSEPVFSVSPADQDNAKETFLAQRQGKPAEKGVNLGDKGGSGGANRRAAEHSAGGRGVRHRPPQPTRHAQSQLSF